MHHIDWSGVQGHILELSSLLGCSLTLTETSIESTGDKFDSMANANFNIWHESHDKHGLLHLYTNIHIPISIHIWVLTSDWEESSDRVLKVSIGQECDNTSVDHLSNENTNHDKAYSLGIGIISDEVYKFHVDGSDNNIDNGNTGSYENIEDFSGILVSLEISTKVVLVGGITSL